MELKEAVDQYIASNKLLRPLTVEGYKQKLEVFVAWGEVQEPQIALEQVNNRVVMDFQEHLISTHKPHKADKQTISSRTLFGYLTVIKSFMGWCITEELLSYSRQPIIDRISKPKIEGTIIEIFTDAQKEALFKACEREKTEHLKLRDRAILAVLFGTGIRAEELCTLKLKDTHLNPEEPYIKVMGKGRKEREVGLGERARLELQKYIKQSRSGVDGEETVFVGRYQSSNSPLTVWGLDQIISRLGEWARINGVRCSPHTMRHTFAQNYLQAKGGLNDLSRLMGHTDISITELYLRAITAKDVRRNSLAIINKLEGTEVSYG